MPTRRDMEAEGGGCPGLLARGQLTTVGWYRMPLCWRHEKTELAVGNLREWGGEGTCLVTFLVGNMLVFYDPEPPDLLCNEDREVSANFSL